MISSEELRAAIREGRITPDEERRLFQTLAEIAFRLWYDGHPAKCEAPGGREGMKEADIKNRAMAIAQDMSDDHTDDDDIARAVRDICKLVAEAVSAAREVAGGKD